MILPLSESEADELLATISQSCPDEDSPRGKLLWEIHDRLRAEIESAEVVPMFPSIRSVQCECEANGSVPANGGKT